LERPKRAVQKASRLQYIRGLPRKPMETNKQTMTVKVCSLATSDRNGPCDREEIYRKSDVTLLNSVYILYQCVPVSVAGLIRQLKCDFSIWILIRLLHCHISLVLKPTFSTFSKNCKNLRDKPRNLGLNPIIDKRLRKYKNDNFALMCHSQLAQLLHLAYLVLMTHICKHQEING
jgi:hypothetical protein